MGGDGSNPMLFVRRSVRFDTKGVELPFAAEFTKDRRAGFPDLRTDQSNWRFRPRPTFGHKGQRCSAVSPNRPFAQHAAFSHAGWLQSEEAE